MCQINDDTSYMFQVIACILEGCFQDKLEIRNVAILLFLLLIQFSFDL